MEKAGIEAARVQKHLLAPRASDSLCSHQIVRRVHDIARSVVVETKAKNGLFLIGLCQTIDFEREQAGGSGLGGSSVWGDRRCGQAQVDHVAGNRHRAVIRDQGEPVGGFRW